MKLAIFTAFGFFTRLPVPQGSGVPLARASWAFAPVGAVVGLLAAIVYLAALYLGATHSIAAWLAVGALVLLDGGLHEDGLADTADALAHGRDREQKLAIMRDSRIGTYGVLALVITLALRAHSIASLGNGWVTLAIFMAAGAASRVSLAVLMHLLPNAREDGLANLAGKPTRQETWIAAGLGALALLITGNLPVAFICLLALILLGFCIARTAQKHFGGITGDVLGAAQQLFEVTLLVILAAGLHS